MAESNHFSQIVSVFHGRAVPLKKGKFYIYYFLFTILALSCRSGKHLTGKKDNGSRYRITLYRSTNNDNVILQGKLNVTGDPVIKNGVTRGVIVDSNPVKTDEEGNFRTTLIPGPHRINVAAIGFGKMETADFTVKKGDSVVANFTLYPEAIVFEDSVIRHFKTIPK
jgi:hypothetical protein